MGVELLLIIGLQAYQSLSQNNIVIVSAPFFGIAGNQYNTKINEYPDKRQVERKYHFIQFHHR